MGPIVINGDTNSPEYIHVFDGFHSYTEIGAENETVYFDYITNKMGIGLSPTIDVDDAFDTVYAGDVVPLDRKATSVTVTPAFDTTGWSEGGLHEERDDEIHYRDFWQQAIDRNIHSVLITSWNEWHEGTEIEPSLEHGFEYLNLTRQYSSEYKNVSITSTSASFDAVVEQPVLDETLFGSGSITILTSPDVPALFVRIDIQGDSGVVDFSLETDSWTYLSKSDKDGLYLFLPYVLTEKTIGYQFMSGSGDNLPQIEIAISVIEPNGKAYDLYNGTVTPRVEEKLPEPLPEEINDTSKTNTLEEPELEPDEPDASNRIPGFSFISMVLGLFVIWTLYTSAHPRTLAHDMPK
ncbi:hypothetical protein HOC87_02850 [Candidatus Bathyarchaeota archaeon]|nr:hypothetical protein [Candidatus Bathyarchaeota archaeon]